MYQPLCVCVCIFFTEVESKICHAKKKNVVLPQEWCSLSEEEDVMAVFLFILPLRISLFF